MPPRFPSVDTLTAGFNVFNSAYDFGYGLIKPPKGMKGGEAWWGHAKRGINLLANVGVLGTTIASYWFPPAQYARIGLSYLPPVLGIGEHLVRALYAGCKSRKKPASRNSTVARVNPIPGNIVDAENGAGDGVGGDVSSDFLFNLHDASEQDANSPAQEKILGNNVPDEPHPAFSYIGNGLNIANSFGNIVRSTYNGVVNRDSKTSRGLAATKSILSEWESGANIVTNGIAIGFRWGKLDNQVPSYISLIKAGLGTSYRPSWLFSEILTSNAPPSSLSPFNNMSFQPTAEDSEIMLSRVRAGIYNLMNPVVERNDPFTRDLFGRFYRYGGD